MESLGNWVLVVIAVSTIGPLFLLRYFYFKKYGFALYSGLVVTIATFVYLIILYRIVAARELQNLYMPALVFIIFATLVHAVSLIVSPAGKRAWLRAAGVCMLAVDLIMGSVLIWSMGSMDVQVQETAREISQWTSLANQLVLVLFIMNFAKEMNDLKKESVTISLPAYVQTTMSFVGFGAFVATLVIGVTLTNESRSTIDWSKRNFEQAQDLAELFEGRTYINSKGDTLLYRLLRPLDYDPQKKYPLVVCLHHGGVHGSDNIKHLVQSRRQYCPGTLIGNNTLHFFLLHNLHLAPALDATAILLLWTPLYLRPFMNWNRNLL